MDDPSFYGFPTFGRPGVKIAQDCGGITGRSRHPRLRSRRCDPGRAPMHSPPMAFEGRLGPRCRQRPACTRLPPDRDFVVDTLPGHPNIHVALGAGHGYKFVAWFGKTLAALASGSRPRLRPRPVPARRARPDRPDVGGELAGLSGFADRALGTCPICFLARQVRMSRRQVGSLIGNMRLRPPFMSADEAPSKTHDQPLSNWERPERHVRFWGCPVPR